MAAFKESKDIEAETSCFLPDSTEGSNGEGTYTSALPSNSNDSSAAGEYPPRPAAGLKGYWEKNNTKSLDGLTGLTSAYKSATLFDKEVVDKDYWGKFKDDESIPSNQSQNQVESQSSFVSAMKHNRVGSVTLDPTNLLVGILLGITITLVSGFTRDRALAMLS